MGTSAPSMGRITGSASIETLVLVFEDLDVFSGEMYVYEGTGAETNGLRWTCLGRGPRGTQWHASTRVGGG